MMAAQIELAPEAVSPVVPACQAASVKNRWISPQAAFNRLLSFHNGNGWTVGEILEGALRRNDLRLRRNGVVLSPADIRDHELYVHVEVSRDGRWTCTIESRLPRRRPVRRGRRHWAGSDGCDGLPAAAQVGAERGRSRSAWTPDTSQTRTSMACLVPG